MGLAKAFVAVGNWIEKHFPEKVTASEIEGRIAAIEMSVGELARRNQADGEWIEKLQARVAELEKKAETVNSEVNKTKIMLLSQRQSAGR